MSVAMKRVQQPRAASMAVHVAESGACTPRGSVRCALEGNISFSTDSLESYFFAAWEAAAYDALLVAAAVEFADKAQKRRAHFWPRDFQLSVPVHDVALWTNGRVRGTLLDALAFLTGDAWNIDFHPRRRSADVPQQGLLTLDRAVDAVIPFSN